MPVFRHQIVIARGVEAVFAAVADVRTHSHWQQGLLQTEVEGDDLHHVGARGVELRRVLGRVARFPYVISVYDPMRAWGFRALEGPIRPSAVLRFTGQAARR